MTHYVNRIAVTCIQARSLCHKLTQALAECAVDQINLQFFNIISQMEPFGPDNMRPIFIAKNVRDTGYSKLVKDAHISFNLTQGNNSVRGIGIALLLLLRALSSALTLHSALHYITYNLRPNCCGYG